MDALEVSPFAPTVVGAMGRRRGIVLVCVVAFGAVGVALGASSNGAVAKSSVVVNSTSVTSSTPVTSGSTLSPADQAAIMKLPSNLDAAAKLVNAKFPSANLTGAAMGKNVTVKLDANSDLVTVSYTDSSPQLAAEAADDVILSYVHSVVTANKTAYNQKLTTLMTQIGRLNGSPDISNTSSQDYQLRALYFQQYSLLIGAAPPTDPAAAAAAVGTYSPAEIPKAAGKTGAIRFGLLGAIVGLILGAAIAYFTANRRPRIENRLEPELLLERPFLAEIPDFTMDRLPSDLPAFDGERSAAAEGFRFAADALESGRTYAVISAVSGDGKSVTVANIAVTAAKAGRRVLAIDGNHDGQGLSWLLGVPADRPGLAEVLSGELGVADAIRRVEQVSGNLAVLPAGTAGDGGSGRFDPEATADLIKGLRSRYDLVVIDAPAVLERAAGTVLAKQADAVVVVVPFGADIRITEEFAKRVSLLGLPVLGYFFTRSPGRSGRSGRRRAGQNSKGASTPSRRLPAGPPSASNGAAPDRYQKPSVGTGV